MIHKTIAEYIVFLHMQDMIPLHMQHVFRQPLFSWNEGADLYMQRVGVFLKEVMVASHYQQRQSQNRTERHEQMDNNQINP